MCQLRYAVRRNSSPSATRLIFGRLLDPLPNAPFICLSTRVSWKVKFQLQRFFHRSLPFYNAKSPTYNPSKQPYIPALTVRPLPVQHHHSSAVDKAEHGSRKPTVPAHRPPLATPWRASATGRDRLHGHGRVGQRGTPPTPTHKPKRTNTLDADKEEERAESGQIPLAR